jgi:dienelactone hydrolase
VEEAPALDPSIARADPPAGTEGLATDWISATVPGLGRCLAAVTKPHGTGPFPAVLLLHGTHGFAREYVLLAQELNDVGLLAVAACWFQGGGGEGSRFISPIACVEAPPRVDPFSHDAMRTVNALVRAVRMLPEVHPDRIGMFGHSRGGAAAVNYVLRVGDVQAAVLNSARYPTELAPLVADLKVPILMLHGTADDFADGGTEATKVEMARAFERLARAEIKPVESVFYEGGKHNGLFADAAQHRDGVERMCNFLRLHLG